MTNQELELLELIRNNEDPEQALITAFNIILDYLKQHESSEARDSVCLRECG